MGFSDILMHSLPAIGGIVGGPVGAAAGTFVSGLMGQAEADKLQGQYKAAENAIPLYDPNQLRYKSDVDRQERSFRAGTDSNTSLATKQALQAGGQAEANFIRAGGPGTFSSILRSQSATQQSIGRYASDAATKANDVMAFKGKLIDNMADRAYKMQRQRADDLMANYARTRQDANNNMLAAVPLLPQLQFGKKSNPGTASTGGPSAFGSGWIDQARSSNIPTYPGAVDNYTMIPGSVPDATSGYDMGQPVF